MIPQTTTIHEPDRQTAICGTVTSGRRSRSSRHRITQAELARFAGVHVSTVSLALRNKPTISPEMRERVRAIAQRMGYVRDPVMQRYIATREASRRSLLRGNLAFVAFADRCGGDVSNENDGLFLSTRTAALGHGYKLDRFWMRESVREQQGFWRMLFHRGIRGVLLDVSRALCSSGLRSDFSRFSVVIIGDRLEGSGLNAVVHDYAWCLREAVCLAEARGYRRIGFVVVAKGSPGLAALRELVSAGRLDQVITSPGVYELPHDNGEGRRTDDTEFEKWILDKRPDLLISIDCAAGSWLQVAARKNPTRLAHVSLGNWGGEGTARFSYDQAGMASLAIESLTNQLRGGQAGTTEVERTVFLPGVWQDGLSFPKGPACQNDS